MLHDYPNWFGFKIWIVFTPIRVHFIAQNGGRVPVGPFGLEP